MKILVLNGSPKAQSDTMTLTNAFLQGLDPEGAHEVKVISSFQKNIQFCTGCLSCWFRQDGHCVLDDDMNAVLDDMAASDLLIWSFPLHYHGMPASLKAILDRTIAFMKINMTEAGGKVDHEKIIDLSAKKHLVIAGGGYPYYPDNFAALKLHMKTAFGQPTVVGVCETALLNVPAPELQPLKARLLGLFTEAGREYGQNGGLSAETVQALEAPMIPNEMYLGIINSMKG